MEFLIAALAVFATYRLATDLAWESGPLGAYAALRGRVMAAYGPDDWRSEGVTCPICWSFWVGLLITALVLPFTTVTLWLWPLWWLGISGASAYLARGHTP